MVSACHQLLPNYISWTAAASNQTGFLLCLGFSHHPMHTNQSAPGAGCFTSLLLWLFWRLKWGWFYFLLTLVWKAAIKKKKRRCCYFCAFMWVNTAKTKIHPHLGSEYSCTWLCALWSRNNCILKWLSSNVIFRKQTDLQAPYSPLWKIKQTLGCVYLSSNGPWLSSPQQFIQSQTWYCHIFQPPQEIGSSGVKLLRSRAINIFTEVPFEHDF